MTIYVPHSKILIAGLSYVQPAVGVSYLQVNVMAEVTMPDVLSVEVVTPVDSMAIAFSKVLSPDTALVSDGATKRLNKANTDILNPSEAIQTIQTSKGLAEEQILADVVRRVFEKGTISDTSLIADTQSKTVDKALSPDTTSLSDAVANIQFGKVLADQVVMTDAAIANRLYIRVFTDDFTVPDFESLVFEAGTTTETASTSDTYNHALTKNFFESTVLLDNMDGDIQYNIIKLISELLTPADSKVIDFAANKSDNVSSSDSGMLSMQDYSDITYFAEDYVGISRTF
jgi:hypothetical protein